MYRFRFLRIYVLWYKTENEEWTHERPYTCKRSMEKHKRQLQQEGRETSVRVINAEAPRL